MKSACPTSMHIHAMVAMAAGMGEPSCETVIDGVRVTVHVPFEGPLSRQLAMRWIHPRAEFATQNGFLLVTAPGRSKAEKTNILATAWNGDPTKNPPLFQTHN